MIADDHPLFRGALREAVAGLFERVDIAEAGTFDEVADLLERGGDVDLVLLDLTMPGVRGFSGLMYLRAQYPSVPVIVVSANDDPGGHPPLHGIRRLRLHPQDARRRGHAQRDLAHPRRRRMDAARRRSRAPAPTPKPPSLMARMATLTPQQVRVLMMLSEGLLNKQIAYQLGVSEATVKAHVSAILQKLGVESRTQAVIAAAKIEAGQWPQGAAGRKLGSSYSTPPPHPQHAPLRQAARAAPPA